MRTRIGRSWSAVAMVLVALACMAGRADAQDKATRVKRQANLITAEEIASANVADAYEAVKRLRSRWLQSRGFASSEQHAGDATVEPVPVAYLDDVRLGALDELQGVPVGDILEIRYHRPSEATQRWGTGHQNGVIQVVRKAR